MAIWKEKEENIELETELKLNGYHPVLARVLSRRFKTVEEVKQNDVLQKHDPFLFKDMQKTVDRINTATKVGILTDFDCDGIGCNVVLSKGFDYLGIDYYGMTGSRNDGYGFHPKHVDIMIEEGCDLIITADVGITSVDTVAYAKDKGIDVIITDHHHPKKYNPDNNGLNLDNLLDNAKEVLPNCYALLDPWVEHETYPFKHLAGVGVAFKVIEALTINMAVPDKVFNELLEIVSVSTVTDVAKIIGENRGWLKKGLELLKNPINKGLANLYDKTNLWDDIKEKDGFQRTHISFRIGPCLNACSRLSGDGMIGYKLLMTDDQEEASQLAHGLVTLNNERQKKQKKMVTHCMKQKEELEQKFIVICNETFHSAICGIVAGKVKDRTGHPCIVLAPKGKTKSGKTIWGGSARSSDRIDIFKILSEIPQSLFKGWGGHPAAAGLTLDSEPEGSTYPFDQSPVNVLRETLNEYFEERTEEYPDELFQKVLDVDCSVVLKELDFGTIDKLHSLAPFGEGNWEPRFSAVGELPWGIKKLVNKKKEGEYHVSFSIRDMSGYKKAIIWNCFKRFPELNDDTSDIGIVFKPHKNIWTDGKGNEHNDTQLVIEDMKVID